MEMINFAENQEKIADIIQQRRDFFIADEVRETVANIVHSVQQKGDSAVREFTARFDGIKLDEFQVSQKEIKKARKKVDSSFLTSLKKAVANVEKFHRSQLKNSWFDSADHKLVGQQITPLKRVGAYVPGGTAAYPSSLLMTVVPAVAAGVEEIVVTTPPGQNGEINPHILAAADEAGVGELYKIGGAQAVAAMAFGTDSIAPVDKIVGPGNIYVTAAKKMVYGTVDIDMLAGPSELLVLADESGNPDYIAADLLSQAEHDPRAVSAMITTSRKLAGKVEQAVSERIERLSRREIAAASWEDNGLLIVVEDLQTGIKLVNDFAPEHFELVVEEPFAYLGEIKNAGAIFVGEYSSEPLGDYMAGPNHVLPTGGTARFSSPLHTEDFIKKSSIIYYGQQGIADEGADVERLARLEGLDGHAEAVKIRGENCR